MMITEPNLESQEDSQVAQQKIWRTEWQRNLVGHLLHCKQDVTRQTGMLQDPVVSPLSHQRHTPNASEFQHKKEAEPNVCPTWMNSWCTTPKLL